MTGELLRVFVPGRCRTKGSLKPMHIRGTGGRPCKIGLTEDHALSKPWLRAMTAALKRAWGVGPDVHASLGLAVVVDLEFVFEQEISTAARGGGSVIPSHSTPWPTAIGIGDVDKLTRSAYDALTQAGVLADDSLIVGGSILKRWAKPGEAAGAWIAVSPALVPDAGDVAHEWTDDPEGEPCMCPYCQEAGEEE